MDPKPLALISIGRAWGGVGLFAFVWLAAAGGVTLKLLHPRRFERLSIAAYLLLGWTVLVALDPLFAAVSLPSIVLLATGGLLYSLHRLPPIAPPALPQRDLARLRAGAACHFAAVLYRDQGRYEDAARLYGRALAIRERALGPKHPSTAIVVRNLASLLRLTDRAAEADALEARFLELTEQSERAAD